MAAPSPSEPQKNPANHQTGQLQVELPPDLTAIYSNIVRISHTPSEIILDFAQMLPGQPNPEVLARLLLSPVGAKLFYRALAENLARYEASFGEINTPGDSSLAGSLFRRANPE